MCMARYAVHKQTAVNTIMKLEVLLTELIPAYQKRALCNEGISYTHCLKKVRKQQKRMTTKTV